MLLFSVCLPLPMKETTPLREVIFDVYCEETFINVYAYIPDGVINSVGTSFKTCKNLPN